MTRHFFTVGHSTHPIERFVELLRLHQIDAIADVRSSPFSRMSPQFSRDALKRALAAAKIRYSFVGAELGARPRDPACYVGEQAKYDLIARTGLFAEGLRRLDDGAEKFRVALMCAEKDPMTCHRAILVGRALINRGDTLDHVLANGTLEPHDAGMTRLAASHGISLSDMFRTRAEALTEVYERQAQQIEYRGPRPEIKA